nr:MAG TPA: hypothetical protein [Caudoviricetes sp.]
MFLYVLIIRYLVFCCLFLREGTPKKGRGGVPGGGGEGLIVAKRT